eukprot:Gb_39840 [translate_table: standard]
MARAMSLFLLLTLLMFSHCSSSEMEDFVGRKLMMGGDEGRKMDEVGSGVDPPPLRRNEAPPAPRANNNTPGPDIPSTITHL